MPDVVSKEHSELSNKLKQLISVYNENKDLILMGGYAAGQDADLDEAYKKWPRSLEFLKQNPSKIEKFGSAFEELKTLLRPE